MSLYDELAEYERKYKQLLSVKPNMETLKSQVQSAKGYLKNNYSIDSVGLEEKNMENIIKSIDNSTSSINASIKDLDNKISETKQRIRELEEAEKRRKEEEERRKKEEEEKRNSEQNQ